MQSKEIIFILGVGRSGTSLLQSMLNAHTAIAFLPETQFFRKYLIKKPDDSWREKILADPKIEKIGLDPQKLIAHHNPKEAYFALLNFYLENQSKLIAGDKDPRLLDYAEILKAHFPTSKVVHIIRDPRDVVLSRTKADWSKRWPVWLHAATYDIQMKLGRTKAKSCFKDQYCEIYYEELISNPVKTLEQVCDHLGVPFEKSMLSFQESAEKLVRSDEMQWKKETLGDLLPQNRDKWKNNLTPLQVRTIEKVCASAFKHDRYQLSQTKLTLTQLIPYSLFVLGSRLFGVAYPIRLWLNVRR